MRDIRKEFWGKKEIIKEFSSRSVSLYIKVVLDKILSEGKFKHFIDVGCGGGRYSKYLKEHMVDVVAVDRHPEIAIALKKEGVPFVKADMTKLPFRNDQFDVLLSIGVLHNALSKKELCEAIVEGSRVLKKGGLFLCSIFTSDLIGKDLNYQKDGFFLINNFLPMVLLPINTIDNYFFLAGMNKLQNIDEHITNVGTGERYVYTALYQKK